jgi:tetratricopeptide (TPR) repeat protein
VAASTLQQELERLLEHYDARPVGRIFAPLADCYRKLGRLEEALDLCEAGLENHPGYTTAHVIRAKILRDRGSEGLARDAFAVVLDLDPYNLLARRELAELCERLDERDAALEHWCQLLATDPGSQLASDAIERLEAEADKQSPYAPRQAPQVEADEAEESQAAAVKAEILEAVAAEVADEDTPSGVASEAVADAAPIATETLARIYYEQGFRARALEIFEQLLEQNPEDGKIKRAIMALREELFDAVDAGGANGPAAGDDLLEDSAVGAEPVRPVTRRPKDVAPVAPRAEVLVAHTDPDPDRNEDFAMFRSWLSKNEASD